MAGFLPPLGLAAQALGGYQSAVEMETKRRQAQQGYAAGLADLATKYPQLQPFADAAARGAPADQMFGVAVQLLPQELKAAQSQAAKTQLAQSLVSELKHERDPRRQDMLKQIIGLASDPSTTTNDVFRAITEFRIIPSERAPDPYTQFITRDLGLRMEDYEAMDVPHRLALRQLYENRKPRLIETPTIDAAGNPILVPRVFGGLTGGTSANFTGGTVGGRGALSTGTTRGATAPGEEPPPAGLGTILGAGGERKPLSAMQIQTRDTINTALSDLDLLERDLRTVGKDRWNAATGTTGTEKFISGPLARVKRDLQARAGISTGNPDLDRLLPQLSRTRIGLITSLMRIAGSRNLKAIEEQADTHLPAGYKDYDFLLNGIAVMRRALLTGRAAILTGRTTSPAELLSGKGPGTDKRLY